MAGHNEPEKIMTSKEEALRYIDAAMATLLSDPSKGVLGGMWAGLVKHALDVANDARAEDVERLFDDFQGIYWLECRKLSIKPHDMSDAKWEQVRISARLRW
jgi:hypothetical protein